VARWLILTSANFRRWKFMKKIQLIIILLVSTVWLGSVRADIYSGEVTAEGQDAQERAELIPSALIHVLQKVSGLRDIPPDPALDPVLANAPRMVVSTHYRKVVTNLPDGTALHEQRLVVDFLPQEINRAVVELGLPRWRIERQPVDVWVVVDEGTQRRLMPVEFQYAWDAVSEVAAGRGLPLSWPSLDSEQAINVDLQLLWGGFTEQLSADNEHDVMIAAARREGPEWSVRWTLASGERLWNWRSSDADLSWALVQGAHQAVDTIANANTIGASAAGSLGYVLEVGGLRSAGDYGRCLQYLEGLSLVDRVTVEAATPGRVRFRLELNAAPEYLEAAFDSDRALGKGLSAAEYLLLP
jgi:hypothetical protein